MIGGPGATRASSRRPSATPVMSGSPLIGYDPYVGHGPAAAPAAGRTTPEPDPGGPQMARPTLARFYVNSGIVSSRSDIHNLLRPLEKQPVSYRYYRGRDLMASGTGFVERVVIDEPETSSYFTPVSICLNVDSFEHLDFETRPDQLIVYTLVEGDEKVVLEYAPLRERGAGEPAPGQLAFDTSGFVQMELLAAPDDASRGDEGP
jgi:hypothetical protein